MIRVERVELLGWDIQADQVLILRPGVNLLTGENGSGKTSILDAIKVALGASRIGADRSIGDYLRSRGLPVAMVRLVVGNRPDPDTARRPFDVLGGGYQADQVSLAAVFRKTDDGWERRDYIVDGDVSPLAPGVEARAFDRRSDYHRRLERLGLGRSFLTLITTPQGEVASLCRRSPPELFDLLFDFIGGREVLEEWERLRRDYDDLERRRRSQADALAGTEERLTALRKRLEVHQRYLDDHRMVRRLELAVPLAQRREAEEADASAVDELRRLDAAAREEDGQAEAARAARDAAAVEVRRHEERVRAVRAALHANRQEAKRVDAALVDAQVAFARLDDLRKAAEGLPARDLAALEDAAAMERRAAAAADHALAENAAATGRLEEELAELDRGVLPPPDTVRAMRERLATEKIPHQLLFDLIEPDPEHEADRVALESYLGDLRFGIAVPDVAAFVRAVAIARELRFPYHVLAPDVRARPPRGEHPLLDGVQVKEPRYEGLVIRLLRRVQRLGPTESIEDTFRERGARVDPGGFVLDRLGGVFRGTDRFYLGRDALVQRRRQLESELADLAQQQQQLTDRRRAHMKEAERLERQAEEERTRRRWEAARPEHVAAEGAVRRLEDERVQVDAERERLDGENAELAQRQGVLKERLAHLEREVARHYEQAEALRARRAAEADKRSRHATALAELVAAAEAAEGALTGEEGSAVLGLAERAAGTLAALLDARRESLSRYTDDDRDSNLPNNVRTLDRQVRAVRGELDRLAAQVDNAHRAADQAHEQYQRTTRRVFRHYFGRLEEEAKPIGFTIQGALRDRDDGRFEIDLKIAVGDKAPVPYTSQALSGGEKAAVSILMSMSTMAIGGDEGPGFFLIDEPFAASDTHKIRELGTFLARTGGQYLISMPTSMDIARCGAWLQAVWTCTRTPGGVSEDGALRLAPPVKLSVVEP